MVKKQKIYCCCDRRAPMQDYSIYQKRIKKLYDEIHKRRYYGSAALEASYIYDRKNPIPYEEAVKRTFKPIQTGKKWGQLWGSAWFKLTGTVPPSFGGKEVVALVDVDGEGCLFENGTPRYGLTYSKSNFSDHGTKRRIPLYKKAKGGEPVSLLIEAAANQLFGSREESSFVFKEARLTCLDRQMWQLALDFDVLIRIAGAQSPDSPRYKQIIAGLNEAANLWNNGNGLSACKQITASLLSQKPADGRATVWSVGHAHLDLGWLWPVRETRRKGGRTFATALKLIEEYPEYIFGASQPQLYAWVKEDYPQLFKDVKKAVAAGRWECQGGMWVEPDMNLTSGESLVRQCYYGKDFFAKEFGIDVKNLWLPDVFGYSAALPQILKKSGIDYFMTQKISWNEFNVFPHHTFMWEGIDGTEILTHFLPTNNYNLENTPDALIEAEKRFSQHGISDDFLNLYGIGDGGAGPSRRHIEFGKRQMKTEGVPRFKFSSARAFFEKIAKLKTEKLPKWCGELYLELHRGTYTSQAKIKKYNRLLELRLRDAEFLLSIAGRSYPQQLDRVWKDTLLNQFHDILPGSSITWVYRDANALSEKNLASVEDVSREVLETCSGGPSPGGRAKHFMVYNTLSWRRTAVVRIPSAFKDTEKAFDGSGTQLTSFPDGNKTAVIVTLPPMGYTTVELRKHGEEAADRNAPCSTDGKKMENDLLRLRFAADGSISSIYDKERKREVIKGRANRLLLWEDKPYSWEAWDISHYYRQTAADQAVLTGRTVLNAAGAEAALEQRFRIGNSIIFQRISMREGSREIRFSCTVDWREEQKNLRVQAETNLKSLQAAYEIQFGLAYRPTHENTSWDKAMFEAPGQRFADLSQPDYGFAVLNDCKYGHYIRGGIVDLSLLRSPKSPDPEADMHEHAFTYSYYPHPEDLAHSDVLQKAHELNSPPITHPLSAVPEEREKSFFSVTAGSVVIDTVKPAYRGGGRVLRLYESMGRSCSIELKTAAEAKTAFLTNLLENEDRELEMKDGTVSLAFTPFEIKTLLLK